MDREQLMELLKILGEAQGHLYKGMKAYKKIEEAIKQIDEMIKEAEYGQENNNINAV